MSCTTPETLFEPSISKIRNRDQVIRHLLPKIFAIIRERGRPGLGHLGLAAPVNDELTLAAYAIDAYRVALSVYWPVKGELLKVFSAYVIRDRSLRGDPGFFRYMDGQVGVMSWRRGQWEDLIAADATSGGPPEMTFSNTVH
jgi:hypothetical protein